jgi:enoyl-CoA hydratase/carnithine racemase
MLNSEGPDFSKGADFDDLTRELDGEDEIKETFANLGGRLVERIDCYPKPTLVAARGICFGGSSAIFSALPCSSKIRIGSMKTRG